MKTFKQFMKEGGFVHRIKDLKTLPDKEKMKGYDIILALQEGKV